MEEKNLFSEFDDLSIVELESELKQIKEQYDGNASRMKQIQENLYDPFRKSFLFKEVQAEYDKLIEKNEFLAKKSTDLRRLLLEKKKEITQEEKQLPFAQQDITKSKKSFSRLFDLERAILQKLNELEERYKNITEEFDQFNNAGLTDSERFDALWRQGNALFDEKRTLNLKLDKLKKQKIRLFKTDESSVGGFPLGAETPYRSLYQQAGGELVERRMQEAEQKKWSPDGIENRLRSMIALFNDLKNKKVSMSPQTNTLEELKKINESIKNIDTEMLALIKDERTPDYIYEIYRNERFPSEKIIPPLEQQSRDEELLFKPGQEIIPRSLKPLQPRKRVTWAQSVEEFEADRPERERRRAEMELLQQKNITPGQKQTSDNEESLKKNLKELQHSLVQFMNKLVVRHI